jgi:Ni,Fe-hydrogenase III component G
MIKERDELRTTDPTNDNIKQMNQDISDLVLNHKREKWKKTVEEVDRNCSSKLFKLIKRLNGNNNNSGNRPIKFKGKYISSPSQIANNFNKQYTSVVHHKSSKESRKITKNIRKNKLENPQIFSPDDTKEAIKKSKPSKALAWVQTRFQIFT